MNDTSIHLRVGVASLGRASPSSKVILNLDTSHNLASLLSQVLLLVQDLPFFNFR